MADSVKISRSNYILKTRHKTLSSGTIYERDYMTTNTSSFGWGSDTVPYGDSNFKMTMRTDHNKLRKRKYGDWVMPQNSDDTEFWIKKDCESTVKDSSSKIEDKPNYNSLSNFAYYGSAYNFVEQSLTDIIAKFPAELYVTDRKISYIPNDDEPSTYLGNEIARTDSGDTDSGLVVIENPFNIDIISNSVDITDDINEERYFCLSSFHYCFYDDNGKHISCADWEISQDDTKAVNNCYEDGNWYNKVYLDVSERDRKLFPDKFVVYNYYYNGKFYLMCDERYAGYHIRLSNPSPIFEEFDDFQKTLLNRDSSPLYTSQLYMYYETETGIRKRKETLTWPSIGGWNILVDTDSAESYFTHLLDIAEMYDKLGISNVLWDKMVHDAIKNTDISYSEDVTGDIIKDEDNDYSDGVGRIESLFQAYAKIFDFLKFKIDNIKNTNNISYDQNDNTPDYFLTDNLELSGWEASNVTNGLDGTVSVNKLFDSENSGKTYTSVDANLQFLRNLKLNSESIFSRKGTRNAIEMLLGLFGLRSYDFVRSYYPMLHNDNKYANGAITFTTFENIPESEQKKLYDYKIDEYVVVASNTEDDKVDTSDELPVETFNKLKSTYEDQSDGDGDYDEDTVQGLPVAISTFLDEDGIEKKIIIPWFSKVSEIDGNPYFQMYGGWGKIPEKKITDSETPDIGYIYTDSDFTIYSETSKYLGIVKHISDLAQIDFASLSDNEIFYVYDIDDYISIYNTEDDSGCSHYFILKNTSKCTTFGVDESDGKSGWVNIPDNDVQNGYDDGIRVLYLESLIDNNLGNNPHTGKGTYDDGKEYLNYFKQLFKYSIENDGFSSEAYNCDGSLIDGIENVGFTLTDYVIDNQKCWYYTDSSLKESNVYKNNELKRFIINEDTSDTTEDESVLKMTLDNYTGVEGVKIGHKASVNGDSAFESDLEPFNLYTQEENSNDEAASDSVINVKKLKITFTGEVALESEFREYFYNTIFPYLAQVIPSTSIFEVDFEGGLATPITLKTATAKLINLE